MSNETKATHTPAPWTCERMLNPPNAKDRRCGFVVNGPDDADTIDGLPVRVCDLRVPRGWSGFAEGEANARLIAAAPDLLAALRDVQIALAQWRDSEPVNVRGIDNLEEVKYLIVDAAITKATD